MFARPARTALAVSIAVLPLLAALPAGAEHITGTKPMATDGHGVRLVMPIMNPERGKKLFVNKGCVACHSVNGVGGHDAPPMDAHDRQGLMNPFDFAAKMWNHAQGMIAAQEDALGDQITFTGDELADIIAFVHDDSVQHTFSEKDLSAKARKMLGHEHGGEPAAKAHAEEVGHDGGEKHEDGDGHKD